MVDMNQTQPLSLHDELLLLLLDERTGYFHPVSGWVLNCAVVGAALAELSLRSRVDTDLDSLKLLDRTPTGDPVLDSLLKEVAAGPDGRSAQYWIERLSSQAEWIIDHTLERLVALNLLEHHSGDFWTLAPGHLYGSTEEGTIGRFVRARVEKALFTDEIPDPRDIIVICLVRACDAFRIMFELDQSMEERIELISRMDLIGRSIAAAVEHNIVSRRPRHSTLARKIPVVPLRRLLRHPLIRGGNLPAIFAALAEEYGPVFQIRPPWGAPVTALAGPQANQWAHRNGRMHLKSGGYFADFEKIYGASGVMPSLDGTDHFRLRKAMGPGHSRGRLAEQLDDLYRYARKHMATWKAGGTFPVRALRLMINAQLSPMFLSVESQDIIDDLMVFKERAIAVHIIKALPKFMLKTPGMKRRGKVIDTLLERTQKVHTHAQRTGCTRSLADDWLSLHESDPQLVPEANLRFALSAALVASVYLGDALSFAVYAMAAHPELQRKIQREADALFEGGDPKGAELDRDSIDVTHRFLMECLRMYPIVPMSIRDVVTSFVLEGHELPVGSRVYVAQTASHYMPDVFPEPFSFDIERYLPPREEHLGPSYAPYGLGTHRCLGSRWMDLQLAVNLLVIARHFTLEVCPAHYADALPINPIPSMKPTAKLGFRVVEQRRELSA